MLSLVGNRLALSSVESRLVLSLVDSRLTLSSVDSRLVLSSVDSRLVLSAVDSRLVLSSVDSRLVLSSVDSWQISVKSFPKYNVYGAAYLQYYSKQVNLHQYSQINVVNKYDIAYCVFLKKVCHRQPSVTSFQLFCQVDIAHCVKLCHSFFKA